MVEYSSYLDKYISEVVERMSVIQQDLNSTMTRIGVIEDISDLENVYTARKLLITIKDSALSIHCGFTVKDLVNYVEKEYEYLLDDLSDQRNNVVMDKRELLKRKMRLKLEEIREENERIRAHNDSIRSMKSLDKAKIDKLSTKRLKLLEYSSEIMELCSLHGINIADIEIDSSMFDVDTLDTMYTDFYEYMSDRSVGKDNVIVVLREKLNNNLGLMALVIAVLVVAISTPLSFIVAAGVIAYILYMQVANKQKVKRFVLLAGLVFNVDPRRMGYVKELSEDDLLAELEEQISVEDVDGGSEVLEDINTELEKYSDEYLLEEKARTIREIINSQTDIEDKVNFANRDIGVQCSTVVEVVDDALSKLELAENRIKNEVPRFGHMFNESCVFDSTVKLGFNEEFMRYEELDLGASNILFNPKDISKNQLDAFIKVMLINFICNVRPGYLDILVYDPNELGAPLAGFYDPEIEHLYKVSKENLEKILEDLRGYTEATLKVTKGQAIEEYNKESEKIGRTCLPYKLLIILSQSLSPDDDEAIASFMQYSAKIGGVFVWMITDNKEFDNVTKFDKPFEGIKDPIRINPYTEPIEFTDRFVEKLKSLKTAALPWQTFKEHIIPDKDIWKRNADEFIEIDPGYEGGDPSKPTNYTVGHTGDVHAICVGGTGAGKSVFINNVIANITRKYSPNDVRLWLVDFKGTEFGMYLKKPHAGQNFMLPHIDACLCTSDPDYSTSLFKAYKDAAKARFDELKKLGFLDMKSLNAYYRKMGTPEKCWTRNLMIVDEFQVIFDAAQGKAIEELKKNITYIAKVARACGMHIMFCSQSMKGTISDDILQQFTLRFALRCDLAVSQSILGTDYAGLLREQNGYLYVRSSKDKSFEAQKLYRTPFINDVDMRQNIDMLANLSTKNKLEVPVPITYEEDQIHPITEIGSFYKSVNSDDLSSPVLLLGERMEYSTKGTRSNIILKRENNTHIYSLFNNNEDLIMFFKTLMEDIRQNHFNIQTIFNSATRDLEYLCELDLLVDESNKMFLSKDLDASTIMTLINAVMDARRNVPPNELTPLCVFLVGWDKMQSIGINPNYPLLTNLKNILNTCGEYHIHFIFVLSGNGDIGKQLKEVCKFLVTGKSNSKISTMMLDSEQAAKTYSQENGYMFVKKGDNVPERLKIYQSKLSRQIEGDELIM